MDKFTENISNRESERKKWDRYYASLPLVEEDEATKKFNEEFAEQVSALLPSGSCILEAGCGGGWQSLAFARLGKYNTSLMDFSQEALKYAQRLFERENLKANFIYGDVLDLGKPEYDLVFNAGVLEHYTFDQQVAFLRGVASRSRKYVLILVPNRLCYWYWLWRIQKSGNAAWPFGKEAPVVDLSAVFKTAGLHFLGQMFMGEAWTEAFINGLDGMDESVCNQILKIHRSPLVPKAEKSYLVAALGSVTAKVSAVPGQWGAPPWEESIREAEIYATLGDALALRINADGQIASLHQAVAERDGQIASLNQAVAERDGQITKIKQSASWRITMPIRVTKNLFISPRRTLYSIARSIFWHLPAGVRQLLHAHRHRFVRLVRQIPTPQGHLDASRKAGDLNWSQFQEVVLSRRDSYKGVCIQEKVIEWNAPLYSRPQHLAVAFGRLGYLVIYRTDNLARDNVDGFREVAKNTWLTNRHEVDTIQAAVHSVYSTASTIAPESLIRRGKRGALVYEYIDHIDPEISGDQENINHLLRLKKFAFNGGADFIVASAKKLYDEAVLAVGTDKVILVPNGVDTAHYRNPIHKTTVVPDVLIGFKAKHKAVIGYFGALAPWLWYEVIAELVEQRPDLGFVFIGPDYYGGADGLPKSQNVLPLGTVDYKVLPAYAYQFDICFIPFKPGEIAKTTSPLKLFEYFALEKPVVVTADMDECTTFPEVFRGDSSLSLSSAIDAAIKVKDDASFKRRLAQLADENDWLQRARAMEICFGAVK